MEFSFGLIFGGFLGFAAWLHYNSPQYSPQKGTVRSGKPLNSDLFLELISILMLGLFVYSTMSLIEIYLDTINNSKNLFIGILATAGRVFVSYVFIGLMLIMIALYWPFLSFQIIITLTFCASVIDIVDDAHLFPELQHSPLLYFGIIVVTSLIVGALVAVLQRKKFVLKSMLLMLVWSTMAVAIVRLFVTGEFSFKKDHSLTQILIGDMFVFNVFFISAIVVSVMVTKNKLFRLQYEGEEKLTHHNNYFV